MKEILDMTVRELIKANMLVYVNEESYNVGQLYVSGKRVRGLQQVRINAQTTDTHIHYMQLELKLAPSAFNMQEV